MISKIKITDNIIKTLTDEQLDELVYNKAADLYLGTFGEQFADHERDKLLRDIFSLTVLDNEVKNGGFNQFFKSSGDLKQFALSGLRLINADRHADLLEKATVIHDKQKEDFRDKGNTNLNSLDDDYYKLDDIGTLRQRFVRTHINKFGD